MPATAQANTADFLPFQTINTTNLAAQYEQFQFWKIPQFVRDNERLSSTAKYLYGEFNFKAGEKGYIERWKREDLAAEAKLDLQKYKRALGELTAEKLILSLPCGNGQPNVYVMLAHPDMQLPEQELIKRRIKLPRRIQIRIDRLADRLAKRAAQETSAGSNMSQLTPSAGSNMSQLFKDLKIPFKDTIGMASAWPTSTTIVDLSQQINSHNQPVISGSMGSTFTFTSTDLFKQQQPSQPSSSNPSSQPNSDSGSAAPGGQNEPKSEPVTKKRSEKREKPKKPKVLKPRSKHSLELCMRFAISEQQRKGTIESVENFAEACYHTGWHDSEIDGWLKRKARMEVGKYQQKQQSAPAQQPKAADQPDQTPAAEAAPAQSTTASDAAINRDWQEIHYQRDLEQRREAAYAALSHEQQQQLLQDKYQWLRDHPDWPKYKRFDKERLLQQQIYLVQVDLVPE